ncbi:MAG: DNA polymerase III subunit delta [Planctomycetota bacterium]|jgi:DNA polymerase-3 subunit delta
MAAKRSSSDTLDPSKRIVVLHGREQYLLTERTRRLAELLEEAHGQVQTFLYDGSTCAAAEVLDELRSYGLLGGHKLVILDHADDFLTQEGHRPLMERYVASPVEDATLLMRAETWRRSKLDKLLEPVGSVIACKEVTEKRATRFCIERCGKQHDATIEPDAAARLVALIGPDLARLDTELAKLASFVGSGQDITLDAVGEMVGLGRDEEFWIMKRFIASGRPDDAIRQLRSMLERARNPRDLGPPVTWSILDVLRRVHAAARLLAEGVPPGAVAGRLNLKWGEPKDEIIAAAQRLGPGAAAQLLQRAIDMDMRTKTGLGDPVRTLEAATVLVTDTLSCRDQNRR